jgi:hypothetical protein
MSYSIIIPSRNIRNSIMCVSAIRKSNDKSGIIIVDDFEERPDFRNGHGELFAASGGDASDIQITPMHGRAPQPFCYARNVNIGINAAGTDDVILLNDDALLETPGGFAALAYCAGKNPHLGIIAATCNNVGNVNQQRRKAGGALRIDPRMVCFICVYIPRSTIERVGLLDERFIDYGLDDDDYCLRIRKTGLGIGIFDGCYVDHGLLTSSFRGAAGRGGDFTNNLRRYIEKWGVDNRGMSREISPFASLFPPA